MFTANKFNLFYLQYSIDTLALSWFDAEKVNTSLNHVSTSVYFIRIDPKPHDFLNFNQPVHKPIHTQDSGCYHQVPVRVHLDLLCMCERSTVCTVSLFSLEKHCHSSNYSMIPFFVKKK